MKENNQFRYLQASQLRINKKGCDFQLLVSPNYT